MSDAREQSYYEIALTNRQVMSIFIVLLVCLLASFVSGVWIGRQGAGVRVQTADAQRIEGESGSGEALQQMDFFSDRAEAATGGETAAGLAADPVATADPPASDPPAASRPPEPEPAAPAAADPEPRPAEPAPRSPIPTAASPSPAASSPPAGGEFLYIQVFSGLDREQAQSIVDTLRDSGYAAFMSSVEVDSRLMHRVRIGPYSERAEAETVAGEVQRKHKLSTWITP